MDYTVLDIRTGEIVEEGHIVDELANDLRVKDGCRVEWSRSEDLDKISFGDILGNACSSDECLNDIIRSFINQEQADITIEQFRSIYCFDLRRYAYPAKEEYLDAMVKIASDDETMRADGAVQLARYYADCIAVKTRFPKPEE